MRRPGFSIMSVLFGTMSAWSGRNHPRLGKNSLLRRYTANVYAWCIGLVAAEALVVLVGLGQGSAPPISGDAHDFHALAANLIDHGAFSYAGSPPYEPTVARMPGYPAFLALLRIVSHSALLARLVQFALLAATACLLYRLAANFVGRRAAAAAAILCATYLPLVWFADSHEEVVAYSFCVVLCLLLFDAARRRHRFSLGRWALVGLACAVATYIRPDFATFAILLAAGALIGGRGSYRRLHRWLPALTIAVVFLALIAPWSARNASVTGGAVVPLDASSGISLFASAEQYAGVISYKMTAADYRTLYTRAHALTSRGARSVRARADVRANSVLTRQAWREFGRLSAGKIVRSLPRRLAYLWSTGDQVPPAHAWTRSLHVIAQVQYGLLITLGLIGAALSRRRLTREWLLWLLPVYLTLLHLVFHALNRYTVPARLTLLIYCGIGLAGTIDRVAVPRLSKQRAAA